MVLLISLNIFYEPFISCVIARALTAILNSCHFPIKLRKAKKQTIMAATRFKQKAIMDINDPQIKSTTTKIHYQLNKKKSTQKKLQAKKKSAYQHWAE